MSPPRALRRGAPEAAVERRDLHRDIDLLIEHEAADLELGDAAGERNVDADRVRGPDDEVAFLAGAPDFDHAALCERARAAARVVLRFVAGSPVRFDRERAAVTDRQQFLAVP